MPTSFRGLKTSVRNSLEAASAIYMIYGVIYGGVEVRQAKAALCINQNEKCYVVFCHFVFNFFYLLSHNPQSKRALWLDSRRIWIFFKKRKKSSGCF